MIICASPIFTQLSVLKAWNHSQIQIYNIVTNENQISLNLRPNFANSNIKFLELSKLRNQYIRLLSFTACMWSFSLPFYDIPSPIVYRKSMCIDILSDFLSLEGKLSNAVFRRFNSVLLTHKFECKMACSNSVGFAVCLWKFNIYPQRIISPYIKLVFSSNSKIFVKIKSVSGLTCLEQCLTHGSS